MANALSFEDLIPSQPAKKAPALPSRAPSLPASLQNVDPRTARVVPLAPSAAAPSFNDLTPRLSPGAEAVRQQVRAQGAKGVAKTVLPPQALAALMGAGNSMTFGLAGDMAAGLNAGKQGLSNLVGGALGQKTGPSMADTYAGTRQAYLDEMRDEGNQTPLAMTTGRIAGAFGAPGAARVADFVSAPSLGARAIPGTGILPTLARVGTRAAETTAKSAAVGAGYGAVDGFGESPDGQRLNGALEGAKVGGVLGAVAPAGLKALEVGTNRLAAPVFNGGLRLVNKASGGAVLDPQQRVNDVIGQALAADMKARGVAPKDIPAAMQQQIQRWAQTGSPTPTLMDLAGENTRAAMRTAASQVGPGRTAAQEFADRTAANLQGQAINRTRQLTPNDNRPADQVLQALKDQRRADADTQYRAPYAAQVDPGPVMDALQGDAAAKGIGRAITESDAMRLQPQTDELRALRQNTQAPDPNVTRMIPAPDPAAARPVTLGTLDRIKVAYNGLGQDAEANGVNGAAAGYYDRANQIDQHLANLPGPEGDLYRQARDNYALLSGHMDAMKAGDINVANADPDMFNLAVANMTPEQRNFAQIQLRQNLTNAIGSPTEGAVGALNKIATSDNATRNLATIFGPDDAANYQAAIKNSVNQVKNAQFVAPNTGPKSANLLLDADAATRPHHLSLDPMDWVMAARRAGMLLTPQESEMLVKAGQMPASAANVPTYNPQTVSIPPGALTGAVAGGIQPAENYMPQ